MPTRLFDYDGFPEHTYRLTWETAPRARHAYPREEHLLPLMVVAGAASGKEGHIIFHSQALSKPISGFRFG